MYVCRVRVVYAGTYCFGLAAWLKLVARLRWVCVCVWKRERNCTDIMLCFVYCLLFFVCVKSMNCPGSTFWYAYAYMEDWNGGNTLVDLQYMCTSRIQIGETKTSNNIRNNCLHAVQLIIVAFALTSGRCFKFDVIYDVDWAVYLDLFFVFIIICRGIFFIFIEIPNTIFF